MVNRYFFRWTSLLSVSLTRVFLVLNGDLSNLQAVAFARFWLTSVLTRVPIGTTTARRLSQATQNVSSCSEDNSNTLTGSTVISFRKQCVLGRKQCHSYRTAVGRSWHQATIWDPRPILLSSPWNLSSDSCGLSPCYGAPSVTRAPVCPFSVRDCSSSSFVSMLISICVLYV
jgi:hypothetical protein